ncbi:Heat shock protein HslJ [Flavobacterium succinicans]|uniref:Heat shock protein HslJ n=1 Tax=Flavobacterium succinicans TaxID=29536 RepID=A0A1I4UEU1_9FLAO|nr:META domain-containing protein [Flavobacterium succinicans]SFM87456.1 Heat shock protein HslJ [Flavobacterium succinicans]
MKNFSLVTALIFMTFTSCTTTKNTTNSANSLQGEWVLTFISGPRIAFQGLYPDAKPTINFDLAGKKVFGNNSCNNYTGALQAEGNKISFKDSKMAVTMMACQGNGDSVYMNMLEKIATYTLSEDGKVLTFEGEGVALMRFEKK